MTTETVSGALYDAMSLALKDIEAVLARHGCPPGATMTDWLDKQLGGIRAQADAGPVAELVRDQAFTGRAMWDIKVLDKPLPNGTLLYTHPSLQAAQGLSELRRLIENAYIAYSGESMDAGAADTIANAILTRAATVAEPSIQHAPGDWWDEAAALHAEWSSETMPVAATELGKRTAAFIGDCIARAQAAQQQVEPSDAESALARLRYKACRNAEKLEVNAADLRALIGHVDALHAQAYMAAQQQAEPVGDERAAFEEVARKEGWSLTKDNLGWYVAGITAHAWTAWQARAAQSGQRAGVAEPKGWREFITEVAQQKPEKPDHWSLCGQCQHNAERAQDLIAPAPAPAAQTQAEGQQQ